MTKQNRQDGRVHPLVDLARQQLAERKSDRREFLRTVTLLGVSAGAAYAMAGEILGEALVAPARAAEGDPVTGGILRVAMEVQKMADPALFDWIADVQPGAAHRRVPGLHRARQRHPPDARRELGAVRRPEDLDAPPAPGREVAQRRRFHRRRRDLQLQALARSRRPARRTSACSAAWPRTSTPARRTTTARPRWASASGQARSRRSTTTPSS